MSFPSTAVQTSYSFLTGAGLAGQLADIAIAEIVSGLNVDAAASLPAGIMMGLAGSPVVPGQVRQIAPAGGAGGKLAGIAVLSQAANTIGLQTQAGNNTILTGSIVSLLRKGRILVKPEVAVVAGDNAFYRVVVNGGNTQLGAFTNVADGTATNTPLLLGARFESSSDAISGIAVLSFDLSAHNAGSGL